MRLVFLALFISTPLFSSESFENGVKVANSLLKTQISSIDRDALRKELRDISTSKNRSISTFNSTCISEQVRPEPNLYVFMSFSLPDELLISLSKELEKTGGIFVVRGLPYNSFKEFARKLYGLRKKGLNAPVQINPKLFKKYDIQNVPAFVAIDEDSFDKISGNVSLAFALKKMETGECKVAKDRLRLL